MFHDFIRTNVHAAKAEFYLPAAVDALVRNEGLEVPVLRSQDRWFGVTYPEDKPAVQASIRKLVDAGLYPDRLWS